MFSALVATAYDDVAVVRPRGHLTRRMSQGKNESGQDWSWADPDTRFPTPEKALAALDLSPGQWGAERLGAPERQATGPNGETAIVTDNVIAVRRLTP